MRTFGTDSPELFSFRLEGIDETFAIPLISSLPITMSARFADIAVMEDGDAKNMASLRLELDILRRYLPEDAVESMTASTVGDLFAAWSEASGVEGADSGE